MERLGILTGFAGWYSRIGWLVGVCFFFDLVYLLSFSPPDSQNESRILHSGLELETLAIVVVISVIFHRRILKKTQPKTRTLLQLDFFV